MVDACKLMLEREFEVAGVAYDGRALVDSALRLKPDGVILEIFLPALNGLDAADRLRHRLPFTKLIFNTAISDPYVAAEAFRRGASGYLLKRSGAEEFVAAVRTVMRGASHLSPFIARETVEYLLNQRQQLAPKMGVTPRETEILQLLAEGNSMKQIAGMLAISQRTVAFHKYKMMERLGIRSSAELIQYAVRNHMAPQSENWALNDFHNTNAVVAIEALRTA
jgi:DNA-binding NarL/FixJ family response regulator